MEKWAALCFVCLAACSGTDLIYPSDGGNDAGSDARACECPAVSACCDGCHAIAEGMACNDGLSCTASSACAAGACVGTASMCPVMWSQCQARTCSEVGGCGAATNIREGFDCDDGDANTYGDACHSGVCSGVAYACSVNNGGCGSATCIGNDPAPPTCQCSGRYNVTASEVTDATTGLVWERTASVTTYTHANALTHCSGMGGGWRVPTSAELLGIHTGASGALPRIDGCAFPSAASSYFWSSTAGPNPGTHEEVNFGGCCGATYDTDATQRPVRCVR